MRGENPQPVTQITLGQSIVALTGPWKFHIGDSPQANGRRGDPRWADPNFDDSQWETVDLTPKAGSFDPVGGTSGYVPGWTAKGHPGYWGWAWYRIRVSTAARLGEKLALAGPADVDDAYQVFANGTLLGSFGKFTPGRQRPVIYASRPQMFLLPQAGTSNNKGTATQVLAFRVWMEPHTLLFERDAGGFHNAPLVGEADVVAAHYQLVWLELVRLFASVTVVAALFLLFAIAASSLVFFDRSDPVYLWLAAVFLVTAITAATGPLSAWTQAEGGLALEMLGDVVLNPLILGGWLMVWWIWFRLRRPTWIPKAIAGLTLLYMLSDTLGENFFFTLISNPVNAAFHLASLGIRLLFLLLLVGIAIAGVRQQGWEGGLALPAMLLVGIAQFQNELAVLHIRPVWFPFGAQVTLATIANLTLAAVIAALLLRRALLSVRRQREMALDVKQAQEVQQVLIPKELPKVPGLVIESEYHPAREVGGDFFQILPEDDGSLLIVVGDVSGKGLKAAMTVSTIVGALRNEKERRPAEVLRNLNRVLHGQVKGFVTCAAALITADGAMTIANAGHLSPYRNGEELPVDSGLPLGIVAEGDYPETHYQLAPGDRLTFVSDGVVEATNEKRELFGFERTQAISDQPAAGIAEAAKSFGQQDDISVLRIVRDAMTLTQINAEPVRAVG